MISNDRLRLRRARLIERMRSAQRREAAAEVHHAETVRLKLEQLAERTRSLARLYALDDKARDGADLRSASLLRGHLHALGITAMRQSADAQREADIRLADFAAADRRLQKAQDSRRNLDRELADKAAKQECIAARKLGTDLE